MHLAKVSSGGEFSRACKLEEVKIITTINAQKSRFVGTVFQIKVSVTLVPPLGRRHKKKTVLRQSTFGGTTF